jgi:hypothetical protein
VRAVALGIVLGMTVVTVDAIAAAGVHPDIIGGTVVASPTYVVALCEGESWFDCRPFCGGTLVAPNLVVTARHCADVTGGDPLDCATYQFDGVLKREATIWVTSASPVSNSAEFHRGARWTVPRARACGHDLAFLTLEDAFPADAAVATPLVSDTALSPEMALDVYGYGITGPVEPLDGRRRTTKAHLLCAGGHDSCEGVPAATDLHATEIVVDARVCPGDSGAGTVAPGDGLVGPLSRSVGGTSPCGYGVYTSLGQHALLLARTARDAATRGAYAVPGWVAQAEQAGNGSGLPARAFGATCDDDADCTSGRCRSYDGGLAWTCARPCDEGCPDGACHDGGDGSFCFAEPAPPPRDDSCEAAAPVGSTADARAALLLVLAVAGAQIVRRRQS